MQVGVAESGGIGTCTWWRATDAGRDEVWRVGMDGEVRAAAIRLLSYGLPVGFNLFLSARKHNLENARALCSAGSVGVWWLEV